MKKTKIAFTIFMIFLASNLFPFFVGNDSGKGFLPGNPIASMGTSDITPINQYIIEGASYYLKSYSNFLGFLSKVEMSGLNELNYEETLRLLAITIENLENAKSIYLKLINLADMTPYNQVVQDQLINFDFQGFQNGKYFNSTVYKLVESFLSKGDIRGVYYKLFNDVLKISQQLNILKTNLDKYYFPNIPDLWKIHQNYSDSIFFGQYVAAVFFELK